MKFIKSKFDLKCKYFIFFIYFWDTSYILKMDNKKLFNIIKLFNGYYIVLVELYLSYSYNL